MIDVDGWKGFTEDDFALENGKQHIVFFSLSRDSRAALAARANAILAEKLKTVSLDLPRAVTGGVTITKFDDESIWIDRHDGEGMQLRIDEKWWSDNF